MSIAALAAIFGTSFVVSLTGALSPGPLTTLAVREGVRSGVWGGPLLAAGHGVVELALVVGLALGLDQLLDRDAVSAVIALLGGLFLLWMGLQTVYRSPQRELNVEGGVGRAMVSARSPGDPPNSVASNWADAAPALVVSGAAVSVSNPFWVAWWATIGTAYVAEALDQGAAGVAAFYSAHFLTDLGWLSIITIALASGRRIMSGGVYRGVLAACGVFLLGLGGWFLAAGLGYVL